MLEQRQLQETVVRLQSSFLLQGNKLGCLMPAHNKTMTHIVQDILISRPVEEWQDALMESAYRKGEFDVLTVAGTMKIPMGLMGYRRGVAAPGPIDSAWDPGSTRPRVLTTICANGLVAGVHLVDNEAAPSIAAALKTLVVRTPTSVWSNISSWWTIARASCGLT